MSVKLDVKAVVTKAKAVKAASGNLDEVCRHFFPAIDPERDEAAWKAAKQQLSQTMTTTRKLVKEGLIKKGKTEDEAEKMAAIAVPTFRDGRGTVKGKAVADLIGDLLSEFDDEESDDAAETVAADETVTA